jgi:hypothetical protein
MTARRGAALKHDWLDDGRLLILMPRSTMSSWGGIDTSDYDCACEVADGWLVPFDVNGKLTFLLGGDPGMALVVPLPGGGTDLVRWIAADDEDELIAFALRRKHVTRREAPQVFENSEPVWVLFNAACNPLRYAPPMRQANMPVGRVVADTALVEGGRNAAIVHRFRLVEAPSANAVESAGR